MRIIDSDFMTYRFGGDDQFQAEFPADQLITPWEIFEPAPEPQWVDLGPSPFQPVDAAGAFKALQDFYVQRDRPWIGLDRDRGLPSYLYGNLAEPAAGDFREASWAFLRNNELMLAGVQEAVDVQTARVYQWRPGIHQIEWRQTNREGVPVYGSAVTCTYSHRRLTFVANTLSSVPAGRLDAFTWDLAWPHKLAQASNASAVLELVDLADFSEAREAITCEAPLDLRRESINEGWLADRWILPFLPSQSQRLNEEPVEPRSGSYRSIWRTVLVDRQKRRWLALIDADSYQVLSLERTRIGSTLHTKVFATPQDAAVAHLEDVVLDFGSGAGIANAERVTIVGGRFADPGQANPGDSAEMTARRLLTANSFYHLYQAQEKYSQVLSDLSLQAAIALLPPGSVAPTASIAASLDDEVAGGEYDYQTRTVHLGRGMPANPSTMPPTPAVQEPGLDGDLISHEFTHAISRFLKTIAFEYKNMGDRKESQTRQLDEGLAFYYACSFADNAIWSEFAHADWGDLRKLEAASLRPADTPPDPAGVIYQGGMWWAHVFWKLKQTPGIDADHLILKAVASLAGPIDSKQIMLSALLDPTEQYGPVATVREVLRGTGLIV